MEVSITHHWGWIENTWWTGRIITVKVVNTAAERNVSSRRNPCQSPQLPNRPYSFRLAPSDHQLHTETIIGAILSVLTADLLSASVCVCFKGCLGLGRWQAQYPSCRVSVPSSRSCRLGVTAQRTVPGFIFSHFSPNSGFSLTACVCPAV